MKTEFENQIMALFGTTDIEKLEKISKKNKAGGRKSVFGEPEIARIVALKSNGTPIAKIARQYNTSRQTIYTQLKKAHNFNKSKDYVLRLNFMEGDNLCTTIDVDFIHQKVLTKNYTNRIVFRAFGVNKNPTWSDFEYFLEDRCFPRTRDHLKETLQDIGVPFYDPLLIIEKTQGRMAEDNQWIMMIKRED